MIAGIFSWAARLLGFGGGTGAGSGEISAAAIHARVLPLLGPDHCAMIRVSGLRRPYDFCVYRLAKRLFNPGTGHVLRQTAIFAGPDHAGASFRIYPLLTEYAALASAQAPAYARLYHRTRHGRTLPEGAGAARLGPDDFLAAAAPEKLGRVPGLCLPDAICRLSRLGPEASERAVLLVERGADAHAVALWREGGSRRRWANDLGHGPAPQAEEPAALARALGYARADAAYLLEPLA